MIESSSRLKKIKAAQVFKPAATRIFSVSNQKGGVGKTTTTVNLAAALAEKGLSVLVIDLDPQGNASTALGVEHPEGTLGVYEVLTEGAAMKAAIKPSTESANLSVLPATIDLAGAEIEIVTTHEQSDWAFLLKRALDSYLAEAAESRPDYVFIDCPPSLGILTVNAFVAANEVLLPIQCEYYALEGLTQLIKIISLVTENTNPQLHIGAILLTMFDGRTRLAHDVANTVRSHFPNEVLTTVIPRAVRVSEAPSYGQSVLTYDMSSPGALAYLSAARELHEKGRMK